MHTISASPSDACIPADLSRLAQAVIKQAVDDASAASSRRRRTNALKFLTEREPLATWSRLAGLSTDGLSAIIARFGGEKDARLPVAIPPQPTKACQRCGQPIRFARKQYKSRLAWLPIEPKAAVDAYHTISARQVHRCA